MNKKINIILSILAVITFSGCGGSTNSSTTATNNSDVGKNTRMEINTPYIVQKGDEIEKLSDNTELKIDSNLVSGKSVVTLLRGSASIISSSK